MAKQPSPKAGISRIRFIMLDAEIPEGDLSQITSAIQNALKPSTTIIQQRLPPSAPAGLAHSPQDDSEMEGEAVEVEPALEAESPRAPREAKPRKPISMKVLEIDLTSEPSLSGFATAHSAKNDTERYLVVLAWFKEHRPSEVVTADHIYTCYRWLKWPTAINDFGAILRNLKQQQLVKSLGRGEYEINHLGLARVESMVSGA